MQIYSGQCCTNTFFFSPSVGDILLEVNGNKISSSDIIKPYLSTSGRHVVIAYIPVGKQARKPAKSIQNHSSSEGSRVKRARNLHDRVRVVCSRTSVTRTLMARLPRLFQTRSWVPNKKSHSCRFYCIWDNFG